MDEEKFPGTSYDECPEGDPLGNGVGARGYLRSQNCFPSIFRIPPVVAQDPIVSRVNLMSIQDLTVCTRLVPP